MAELRESPMIQRNDMNKFPREVQDLVLHLVNRQDIRWRAADANHLLLYPPDGVGRPFKVSASRPERDQCRYIERQFMAVYGVKDAEGHVPGEKEEEVVTGAPITPLVVKTEGDPAEAVRTLAAALGVSLGGTVSEEDYLAVVAEKDACQERAEDLGLRLAEAELAEVQWRETVESLTEQRDHLLRQVTRIAEITTEAR